MVGAFAFKHEFNKGFHRFRIPAHGEKYDLVGYERRVLLTLAISSYAAVVLQYLAKVSCTQRHYVFKRVVKVNISCKHTYI